MNDATTLKVSRELHRELVRRSRVLGMYLGDYVERLLLLAMDNAGDDPLKEFKALLQYVSGNYQPDDCAPPLAGRSTQPHDE